jgi:dipeptidyl aminopeptidase/acylaminoacyl peptidase
MKVYLVGAAAAATLAVAAHAEPPPASAFGRLPAIQRAEISPDGKSIAMLGGTPEDRAVTLAVVDQAKLRMLKLGDVETVNLRWAGDSYALVTIALWRQLDPKHSYHFYRDLVVDTDAKAVGGLLEKDDASQEMTGHPIIGIVQGPKARVLVQGLVMHDREGQDLNTRLKTKGQGDIFKYALWNVDPATGRGAVVETGGPDTFTWEVDLAGEPRVRLEDDELSHKFSVVTRAKGEKRWTPLIDKVDEQDREKYLGYSDADDAIYQRVEIKGAVQIMRRRLKDGVAEPVGHPVTGSGAGLLWDELREAPVGIVSGGDHDEVEWLDPEIGAVHAMLARAFKGREVSLKSWSADRTRFVVQVSGASTPATWYLFEAPTKQLSPIGEEFPELKNVAFGPTRSFSYKARDGLEIPAYLTLPPGDLAGRKPPLIVLPHGGPASHDSLEFDWLTQFLASRGYAVLRPQFRGSAGYGEAFERAGRGEWGGKMQTDLLDGVAALAAKGQVDAARVCIVGWSFGGYAAMAGASLHPDAYRCAASMAGISDLGLLFNETDSSHGEESATLRELKRDLTTAGGPQLSAASPRLHAADIRIPVLLMHGDQDTTVPYEQTRSMAEAMKAAGKPVEFVTFEGQDHYLLKSAPRTKLLETLGAFLDKNLPVTP